MPRGILLERKEVNCKVSSGQEMQGKKFPCPLLFSLDPYKLWGAVLGPCCVSAPSTRGWLCGAGLPRAVALPCLP